MNKPNSTYLIVLTGLLLITLTGCATRSSTTKPYISTTPENLVINTVTESGSWFTDIKAYLHLYTIKDECNKKYVGTITLDKPEIKTGIPVNNSTYLSFVFTKIKDRGFSKSTLRKRTVVKPRAGYMYYAEVSYEDAIYHMEIAEMNSKKQKNVLPIKELPECKQSQ